MLKFGSVWILPCLILQLSLASGFLPIQKAFVSPLATSGVLSQSAVSSGTAMSAEVKVGDTIPAVTMTELVTGADRPVEVNLGELLASKKVAMFGVPGAFTPGCSKSHLPSFMEAQEALKSKGVDLTICVATNDAFVMEAWGRTSGGADAGIRFLADHTGELTKRLGLVKDSPVGMRTKRFSLIAENGVVTHYFDSNQDAANTYAPTVLSAL